MFEEGIFLYLHGLVVSHCWILVLLAVLAPSLVSAMSVSSSSPPVDPGITSNVKKTSTAMQRVMVYGSRIASSTPTSSTETNDNNHEQRHVPVAVTLHYKDIPTGISKGNVLIKVVCAGLNPVDAKYIIGDKLPQSWTYVQQWYRERILARGKIGIGFDFSGIVQQCPCGSFRFGDAVFGTMPPFHGTLAEYIVAPLHQVYYKPKTYSFAQAAALPLVGLTALQALSPHILSKANSKTTSSSLSAATAAASKSSSASSTSSSSVLIIGASGGTGHVALQVARNLGATHVTAVCSRSNADFCRQRGATHVVPYQTTSHAELVRNLQSAPGSPYDVILDCVTSADPRDSAEHHYPSLLQQPQPSHKPSSNNNIITTGTTLPNLLRRNYVYLRLGGVFWDWFRAGLRRITYGWCNLFYGSSEELFWVRFPHSAHELKQLVDWADAGLLVPHVHAWDDQGHDTIEQDDDDQQQERIDHEFTPQAVEQAFHAILSRRVQGKLVVRVSDSKQSEMATPSTAKTE